MVGENPAWTPLISIPSIIAGGSKRHLEQTWSCARMWRRLENCGRGLVEPWPSELGVFCCWLRHFLFLKLGCMVSYGGYTWHVCFVFLVYLDTLWDGLNLNQKASPGDTRGGSSWMRCLDSLRSWSDEICENSPDFWTMCDLGVMWGHPTLTHGCVWRWKILSCGIFSGENDDGPVDGMVFNGFFPHNIQNHVQPNPRKSKWIMEPWLTLLHHGIPRICFKTKISWISFCDPSLPAATCTVLNDINGNWWV